VADAYYDYASHAVDLVNYLVGAPDAVGGTVLTSSSPETLKTRCIPPSTTTTE